MSDDAGRGTPHVPDLAPDTDNLAAALAYAKAGWYVLPVKRDKHPGSVVGRRWQDKSSREPQQIAAWFAGTGHGIALHCGRSGAIVFDVDHPRELPEILRRHIDVAPFQQTRPDEDAARGHHVFAMPAGRLLGNGLGWLPKGWGEIRGANGVIIVAPNADGRAWKRTGAVSVLPDEIAGMLADASPATDAATDEMVATFIAEHTEQVQPTVLTGLVSSLRTRIDAGQSRHDSAVTVVVGAMKEARAGYYPAQTALDTLRPMFLEAVSKPPSSSSQNAPRTGRIAESEFAGILAWAVGQALAADLDEIRKRVDEKMPDATGGNTAGWLSDANISALLVNRVLRGKYCWAIGLGWMRWDGKKWSRTANEDVTEQSRLFANALVADAARSGADPDRVRAYTRRMTAGAVRAAADLAKGQLLTDPARFDAHPDLLNVANGVVDLRTGEITPHNPDLLLTRCAPTSYRAGATHPDWMAALDALPAEVADWMQIRFGQAITGYPTPDDVLPVTHGSGANGKTTITGGITAALGEHAVYVPDRVLLANPGDHPTELMTLRGVRLALLEETPEARHLNVKRLKDVLGPPKMTARLIQRDSVEWAPTHSLFVSTNYRPRVEETDHGTWRRLALVSFPYTYRKDGEELTGPHDRRADATLRERILSGRDGRHEAVLAWLVDGARRWYDGGRIMPAPPAAVLKDTRGWRHDSDLILAWYDDTLIADPAFYVPGTDMYKAFAEWLDANGYQKWTSRTFADRFGQHDEIAGQRITHGRVWLPSSELTASRQKTFQPLPQRFRAWLGVRYRTGAGDRAETP
jgi:putative DNA primase/helicase